MGLVSWIAAATAALLIARIIRRSRSSLALEAGLATGTTLVSGMLATALDFGGWNVVDWRSALFAFFVSTASIAMLRLRSHRAESAAKRDTVASPRERAPV